MRNNWWWNLYFTKWKFTDSFVYEFDLVEYCSVDRWGLLAPLMLQQYVISFCRNIRELSLEGCSLLTTEGLEFVVLSWKQLTRLRVVSCNNIKAGEVTPALATLFSVLKELKWRPDSRSLLSSGLAGTGVGQKGGRSFRWK